MANGSLGTDAHRRGGRQARRYRQRFRRHPAENCRGGLHRGLPGLSLGVAALTRSRSSRTTSRPDFRRVPRPGAAPLIDGLEQFIVWGKNLLGIDKLDFKLPLMGKPINEVFDFFGGDNANGASIRRFIDDLKQKAAAALQHRDRPVSARSIHAVRPLPPHSATA